MGTYSDFALIFTSTVFQPRVQHALDNTAVAAYNELPSSVGEGVHYRRAMYAIRVFNNSGSNPINIQDVARAVLTLSSFSTQAASTAANMGISDAELQNAMNAIYNVLAGA